MAKKEYACSNVVCQLTGEHVRQCLEAHKKPAPSDTPPQPASGEGGELSGDLAERIWQATQKALGFEVHGHADSAVPEAIRRVLAEDMARRVAEFGERVRQSETEEQR